MPMRQMSAQSALVMVVIPIYALGCNVTRNSLAVAVPRASENAVFCAVAVVRGKRRGGAFRENPGPLPSGMPFRWRKPCSSLQL